MSKKHTPLQALDDIFKTLESNPDYNIGKHFGDYGIIKDSLEKSLKTPPKVAPISRISKKMFVNILETLKHQDRIYNDVSNKLEEAIEGMRIDFCPHLPFVTIILDLLNIIAGTAVDPDEDASAQSIIDYFVFELNYGDDYKPDSLEYKDKPIDISTADKLYDFILLSQQEDVK